MKIDKYYYLKNAIFEFKYLSYFCFDFRNSCAYLIAN